jgi:hypothetical protein
LNLAKGGVDFRDTNNVFTGALFSVSDSLGSYLSVDLTEIKLRKDISGVYPSTWAVPGYAANSLWRSYANGTADFLVIQPPGPGYGYMTFNTKVPENGTRGETMRLTYDGKVGINCGPTHVLDVSSAAGDSNIRISSSEFSNEMLIGISSDGAHIDVPDDIDFGVIVNGAKQLVVDKTRVNITSRLNIAGTVPPNDRLGAAGDKAGDIASDSANLYYCIVDHTDGVSPIWVRIAWQAW